MAGRMYTVIVPGISAASVNDLVELMPATGKPIRLRRLRIAQTSEPTTEEEQIPILVWRAYTTSGSGGTAVTPHPLTSGEIAASFTAEYVNTTNSNGGTPVQIVADAWNTRVGFDLAFSPEEAIGADNERLTIKFGVFSDAMTIHATFWVEEFG